MHLGNALCALKHFKKMLERHKDDPNCYFIDMSDSLDLIIPQGMAEKKRYKASQVAPEYRGTDTPVDDAIKDYVKLVEPIKDRLICVLDGNHHQTILERCGTDPTGRICEALWGHAAPGRRMGYSGYLRLAFARPSDKGDRVRTLNVYLCHGITTTGKTEGGSLTTIGNNAKYHRADLHIYGHNHRLHTWDITYTAPARYGPKIISNREIRVNTGTFLKQFSDDHTTSYGEKGQFRPSEIGYPVLELEPGKAGIEITYWKKVFL